MNALPRVINRVSEYTGRTSQAAVWASHPHLASRRSRNGLSGRDGALIPANLVIEGPTLVGSP